MSMESLNAYFLNGNMTAIQTAGNLSSPIHCVPDSGELIAVIIHVRATTTLQTTFDVMVNGTDSGIDAILPVTTGATGSRCQMSGKLFVNEGDRMFLQSNGETGGTVSADISFIIKR